ncbi:uncharacterized protein LOC144437761 [Glandiceps talaboti]
MQVFVNGPTGKTHIVDIDKNDTVDELLKRISTKNRIPVNEQTVLFSGKLVLPGLERKVSDYCMQHGSNLFVSLHLKGGVNIKTQMKLPFGVKLTTAIDIITFDDTRHVKRYEMPCGHAIGPESLKIYCRSVLKNGKYRFLCPATRKNGSGHRCDVEWSYTDVMQLAELNAQERREFEDNISQNCLFLEQGVQECPRCSSFCERQDEKNPRVVCSICTMKKRSNYEFCWNCLREWKAGGTTNCGNIGCTGEDQQLEILKTCQPKTIGAVPNCPSHRACPSCGVLIEHIDACKQMKCRCGQNFCFICLKKDFQCTQYCAVAEIQVKIPRSG